MLIAAEHLSRTEAILLNPQDTVIAQLSSTCQQPLTADTCWTLSHCPFTEFPSESQAAHLPTAPHSLFEDLPLYNFCSSYSQLHTVTNAQACTHAPAKTLEISIIPQLLGPSPQQPASFPGLPLNNSMLKAFRFWFFC